MKYKSELIKDIVDTRGHEKSSLHYESECIETWVAEASGAYPKLMDYQSEWLKYIVSNPIGEFPYITLSNVTNATVENVVPYAYKSAILKGQTLVNLVGEDKKRNILADGKDMRGLTEFSGSKEYTVYFKVEQINDNGLIRLQYFNGSTFISAENKNIVVGVNTITLTTPANTTDIRFQNANGGTELIIDDLMILEGDYTNVYITYFVGMQSVKMPVLTTSNEDGTKTIILTVNEEVELRGIGDVKDTLDLTTGELTQRIGEVVLDGSEDWRADFFTVGTNQLLRFHLADVSNCKRNAKSLCDKEKVMQFDKANEDYVRPSANLIWIYRKDLTMTVEDLKQQLQANPYTIQYELATESVKTVDLSIVNQDGNALIKIKPIEGTMYLKTNGEILKPTFTGEVPVEAITQNLASFIKLEMEE